MKGTVNEQMTGGVTETIEDTRGGGKTDGERSGEERRERSQFQLPVLGSAKSLTY